MEFDQSQVRLIRGVKRKKKVQNIYIEKKITNCALTLPIPSSENALKGISNTLWSLCMWRKKMKCTESVI